MNAYQPVPIADLREATVDVALYPRVNGPKEISLGDTAQTFAFDLDDDLIKLVSLIPKGTIVRIVVRYATDAVVQQDIYELPATDPLIITADSHGVVVRWQAQLLPPLPWPVIARKRRF